jgi:hypothetical protein
MRKIMEGYEFFPGGFAHSGFLDARTSTRVVHYDTLKSMKIDKFNDQYFRLTIVCVGTDEIVMYKENRAELVEMHKKILADFLKYKREPAISPHPPQLERIARSLESLEFVPGQPESEAAIERCKKRARGEEEEEQE